jgi:hypothetical protein
MPLVSRVHEASTRFDGVEDVRIAGVRLGAPVARLLSEFLDAGGHPATAARIRDAIERRITIEAPPTIADHEAILEALEEDFPSTLNSLRRELLEERQRLRRLTGG